MMYLYIVPNIIIDNTIFYSNNKSLLNGDIKMRFSSLKLSLFTINIWYLYTTALCS